MDGFKLPIGSIEIIEGIFYAFCSLFGSVLKTLSDNLAKKKKLSTLIREVLANGSVALFCGFLIMPSQKIFKLDPYWALVLSCYAGWQGRPFIERIEKFLPKEFRKDATDNNIQDS